MKFLSKAIATTLLAASCLFAQQDEATQQAKPAQKDFGVGIRGAFNYNMMYGLDNDWNVYSDNDDDDTPSGIGFEVGLAVRLQLLPFMQFTPEVLFNYAGLSQDDGTMERTFKQMGVEFPLLLRVTPIDKLYLAVGPNIELNVSDEVKLESGTMENEAGTFHHDFPEAFERKSVQFGLTFGAGYNIIDRLSADFRMNMGMTEVYKGESLLISLKGGKLMTFKFGLGFWFM
ncbi:MAG: PorT family protein [Fibrobacter sp.]|nr:PorT family protein [Fibrobacter sp.]